MDFKCFEARIPILKQVDALKFRFSKQFPVDLFDILTVKLNEIVCHQAQVCIADRTVLDDMVLFKHGTQISVKSFRQLFDISATCVYNQVVVFFGFLLAIAEKAVMLCSVPIYFDDFLPHVIFRQMLIGGLAQHTPFEFAFHIGIHEYAKRVLLAKNIVCAATDNDTV